MSTIVNAMSVDVEDYFQVSAFDGVVSRGNWDQYESRVVANTRRLLDLLDRTKTTSTFFILGWVAERHASLVREIVAQGHEVASHGYNHQLAYLLTPQQFREDVRSAKATIEAVAGRPVLGYRAPSYSIVSSNLWALDVLIEEGYVYDASIFPIRHDRYGIPDATRHIHELKRPTGTLLEFPVSTVRMGNINLPVTGGGYFRLLPYQWTTWGIRRVNNEGQPAMFYVHPWEIDPDQPRMDVGRLTRVRHYGGLSSTEQRLAKLLQQFRFASVSSVMNLAGVPLPA
ncbi:MAG: XrtA system polysaccharide deacetylase [Vicinamibacterales bacterium]